MELAFEFETLALAQILDQLDYFELLRVPRAASAADIKDAFHRASLLYHPDRYQALPPCPLQAQVQRIYKRVTEAYVILRDDRKRECYLAGLDGPERARKLRFTEESEQEAKAEDQRRVEEETGLTARGRLLFLQAQRELEAGRLEAAIQSLRLASGFEPGNERFKERLLATEQLLPKRH